MPHTFTSIATLTEAIARTLEKYQVDAGDLFERLDLPREPYQDPDDRLPYAKMKQIWDEGVRLTSDPCLGFRVGMEFHVTNYHAVGYAWLGSATLREALERFVRYQQLISTAVDLALEAQDGTVDLVIRGTELAPEAVDAAFCATVQVCRDVSRVDFSPVAVHMKRLEPPCAPEVRRFLGCDVHFGSDSNLLRFSVASIDERLPRSNPALVQASEGVARDYIARMNNNDVVTKARILLIGQMPDGEPSRQRLAEALHMSQRTLARRLSEQDYTFTSLVDEIRNNLARDYLRQSRFSITDVAFLLGFSDQSNFARAFKRWTGLSPTEFRMAA